MRLKSSLFCAAAPLVVAIAGPAYAQTSPDAPTPAPAAAESETQTSDIVVTARLREERAIDVPVAMTVLTSTEINKYNSDSVQRIAESAPGLVVSSTVGLGGGSISIRGVSTAPTTIGFEQPVTIVVDGVPINSSWITSAGFFDLGRAEVLKGPQTLLFGKNNTAGVISLTSADPTDSFSGSVRVSHEFVADETIVDGMLSGPITETLSARFALRYRKMVGWMNNNARAIANPFNPAFPFADPPRSLLRLGDDEAIGRLTLKWEPSPTFTSTLKVTGNTRNNDGPAVASQIVGGCAADGRPRVYNIVDPYGDCRPDNNVAQGVLPPGLTQFIAPADGDATDRGNFDAILVSFNNQWTFTDQLQLASTTGYTKWKTNSFGGFDETSYSQLVTTTPLTYTIFSEELRLLSDFGGAFDFMVGGFYQDFDVDYHQYAKLRDDTDLNLTARTLVAFEKDGFQYNKTYSGFAQMIVKPITGLEIAGGLRYTKETKRSSLFNVARTGRPSFPFGKGFTARQTFDDTSPEVTVAYHPAPDVTIFGGYRTGYKSGGFALSSTITAASVLGDFDFESERVKGFELGVKAALLNRRLRIDLTGYSYRFTDLQVNTYNPATISYTLANAGKLKQTGVDASLYFDLTPQFQLRGAVNWNRNRYGTFIGQCWSGQTAAEGCNVLPGPAQDFTGRAPARSPDWAGNVGASYNGETGIGDLAATADGLYSSSYYGAEALSLGSFQKAFWRLNASARLTFDNGLSLGVVGRNLTNRYYILSAQDKTGQAREQRGVVGRGREVAVEAAFRF